MPSKSGLAKQRQALIEKILSKHAIVNQSDLLAKLVERGIRVTQSSVSRDLREMGVVRVDGRYLPASAVSGGAPLAAGLEGVANYILEMKAAGPNLLVIKTPPGMATSVALALDQADWPEVVGTVAGDDTFFLATAGPRQQKLIEARIVEVVKEAARKG